MRSLSRVSLRFTPEGGTGLQPVRFFSHLLRERFPSLWVAAFILMLPAFAACELPSTSSKVLAATAVFNDLVQAAGNGEKPVFAVVAPDCAGAGPERGAWYEEKRHRV